MVRTGYFEGDQWDSHMFNYFLNIHLVLKNGSNAIEYTDLLINSEKKSQLLQRMIEFEDKFLDLSSKRIPDIKEDFHFIRNITDNQLYTLDLSHLAGLFETYGAKM